MTGFELYLLGAEAPAQRKTLLEAGAKHVGLSFANLRPRLPKTGLFKVADKFPADVSVLLTSGANDHHDIDVEQYLVEYHDLIQLNMERFSLMVEFDHPALTKEQVDFQRNDFWKFMDESKFLPIWRPKFGMEELEELCERYSNVAIPSSAFDDHDVNYQPLLNRLVAKTGVQLHGLGVTQADTLQRIHFASASSMTWITPAQYGVTVCWDGTRLRLYPVADQERARRRHRMLFEKAGFDAEKITKGDSKELSNFTIWSYLRFAEWLQRHRQAPTDGDSLDLEDHADEQVAGFAAEEADPLEAVLPVPAPATRPLQKRHAIERNEGERTVLPVFGLERTMAVETKGEQAKETLMLTSPATSLRTCDTCHVAASCPAYKAESTCAYELPIEIRTKDQLVSAMSALIEMQMGRVGFMRFAEELDGGYPDKNLSAEMDRFFNQVKIMRDITDNRDTFKMHIEARTGAGRISRLFGEHVGEAQKALPQPIDTNDLLEILEGEVVE